MLTLQQQLSNKSSTNDDFINFYNFVIKIKIQFQKKSQQLVPTGIEPVTSAFLVPIKGSNSQSNKL